MQIFLPSPSCLQTARQLDKRRLNKQIIETAQILRAIDGQILKYVNGKKDFIKVIPTSASVQFLSVTLHKNYFFFTLLIIFCYICHTN